MVAQKWICILSYPVCYYDNLSMRNFFLKNILLCNIKGFIKPIHQTSTPTFKNIWVCPCIPISYIFTSFFENFWCY